VKGFKASWLAAGIALASATCLARDLPYGAVGDAGLKRCDAQHWSGQRAAAAACYRSLLAGAQLAVRAEAAWALGDFRSANEWFRDAARADDANPMVRVRWGELFIDTHQQDEAIKLFQEALQRDAGNAWAHVGAASVLIGRYSKEAAGHLEAVLNNEKAPAGARLRAQLMSAQVALENGELAAADEMLKQAAQTAAAGELPRLELFALQASLAQLGDHDNREPIAAALRENPLYGDLYATLAHFYDIRRRYREAGELYRKAVELDPQHWDAHVELANGLLRENRLTEARRELELAYKGDPYNPVTVNTLRLLDSVGKFDTLVYPEPTEAAGNAPRMVIRMNHKESAVLAPYVRRLAEQSMASFSQRYRFELKSPVVIEIYNNHEDFAVRTAGLPGLGLLGVTFGQVLAMDSPSSRAVNEFHWGSTLWHEMAHVYTLESTNHRVPRWLSEGLSVYEEWRTGPIKGSISIPGYVYAALAANKALPVAELDRGFIRPEYEQQVQVSYMQAGLVCEFIDRRWGFDKLVTMLGEFRRGTDTPAALQVALGIDAAAFDRQFREFLQQEFGAVFSGLQAWGEARQAAAAAAGRKDWDATIASAQRALKILPNDVEDGSPYVALAQAQYAQGANPQALETLETYWKRGGHDPQALNRLAIELHALGRKEDAVAVMQSISYVAPFDSNQHGQHGDWLLELDRPADALTEYRVALALNPPDLATAHYRVARAQLALQAPREARAAVLRALEIAPSFAPAQKLLLELARSQPRG